jgi:hypothetical protein
MYYLFFFNLSDFASFVFRSLGGILGWDPVLTICILCERSYKIFIKLS